MPACENPPVSPAPLPLRHFLLALAVVSIWGSNFVIIKFALDHLPPLLFATLRFVFAALPAVLLLPRPDLPWRNLAAFGLLIGVGQCALLNLAMDGHITPGLASLVIQTQVFFTIGLSIHFNGERVHAVQWLALLLAAAGIVQIGCNTNGDTSVLGLALVLLGALTWAGGNIVSRHGRAVNMLAYVAWSSAFAIVPLLALSLMLEGPQRVVSSLRAADAASWAAVLWQSWANALFGYAVWGWLLGRHTAATVMPMALLVPVFGMGVSAWWLGEALPAWKLQAAALVLGGLGLNLLWPLLRARLRGAPV